MTPLTSDTNADESVMLGIHALAEIGVPIAKACRDRGIPRLRYYRWLDKKKAPSDNGAGHVAESGGSGVNPDCTAT